MIRTGIIEDDARIRSFVANALQEDPQYECVFKGGSVEEFLQYPHGPGGIHVLLLDISLPGGVSGIHAIRSLKEQFPSMEIMMFTIYDDSEHIFQAIRAGASGYLLKNTSLAGIKKGIFQLYQGESALTPSVARKILMYFQPKSARAEELTPKEQQVAELLTRGLTYKEIADNLLISVNTLNFHIRNLYRKLQVNSRAELTSQHFMNGYSA